MLKGRWDDLINWFLQFTHLQDAWETGTAFIFKMVGGGGKKDTVNSVTKMTVLILSASNS